MDLTASGRELFATIQSNQITCRKIEKYSYRENIPILVKIEKANLWVYFSRTRTSPFSDTWLSISEWYSIDVAQSASADCLIDTKCRKQEIAPNNGQIKNQIKRIARGVLHYFIEVSNEEFKIGDDVQFSIRHASPGIIAIRPESCSVTNVETGQVYSLFDGTCTDNFTNFRLGISNVLRNLFCKFPDHELDQFMINSSNHQFKNFGTWFWSESDNLILI